MSAPVALTPAALSRLGNWLVSNDTGLSSETMAAVALGATTLKNMNAPHDAADFGRCYRLVKAVPEIRASFPRLARRCKAFAGILKEWDSLVAIYERDLKKGESPELYARIKHLRGGR